MGDDKRAVNTEASLRNGTSQPRVGIGVFASQQGRVTADAPRISSRSWVLEYRWRQAGFSGSSRGRRRPGSLRRGQTQDSDRFFTLRHRPSLASRRSARVRPLIWDGYLWAKQETVSPRKRVTSARNAIEAYRRRFHSVRTEAS